MSTPITTTTGYGIALPAGGGFGASRSGTRCGLEDPEDAKLDLP